MAFKNIKPKIIRNSKSFQAQICFLRHFQGQKLSHLNSPHHKKSFDTKIYHFCGRNRHQQLFSISTP